MTPRARQTAFTLAEVPVALALITVGLLAVGRAQLHALQAAADARHRALAAIQAGSMAAMLHANRRHWALAAPAKVDLAAPPPHPAPDCAARRCAPAELAAHDLADWGAQLVALLPQGAGRVRCGQPAGACRVTVCWRGTDSGRMETTLEVVP